MSGLITWAARNWADKGTVTAVYGADTGTMDPSYPVTNLQNRQLARIARYLSGGSGVFATADLGAAMPVKLVGMFGIGALQLVPYSGANIYEIQVQGSNVSNFSSLVYNNTTGSISARQGSLWLRNHAFWILPTVVSARYWRVRVQGYSPKAFRDVGRLWISDALDLTGAIDTDPVLGGVDPGVLLESYGQQYYEQPRQRIRTISLGLKLTTQQAFGFSDTSAAQVNAASLQALQVEAGTTGEVFVVTYARNRTWAQATSAYGHLSSFPEIQRHPDSAPDSPRYSSTINVAEEG